MGISILAPESAPAGSRVNCSIEFGKEWYNRRLSVTAYWYPGTGEASYDVLVNHGGKLLGTKVFTVGPNGSKVDLGSYTQPTNGSTIGVFIDDPLIEKTFGKPIFEYTTVKLQSTQGCQNGQSKCVGYDLYQCSNGKWVLVEKNSKQCGYVPPQPQPSCTNGQTVCKGYDLYRCSNGKWVLVEKNSASCGYRPAPPSPSQQHGSMSPWLPLIGVFGLLAILDHYGSKGVPK